MAATTIVRKLSVKSLVGNMKSIVKPMANGTEFSVVRVAGLAKGLKHGESNYGPWTSVIGDFVAEPLVGEGVGKRVRAGTLFLPDVALNLIVPAVDGLGKGESVQFAFELTVIVNDDISGGYEYGAKTLIEAQENDPLELLVAKALPDPAAPETAPAVEDKAEEKAAAKGK